MRSVRDRFESRLLELLGADRVHLNCAPQSSLSPPPPPIVNGGSKRCSAEAGAHSAASCARLPNTSNVSLVVVHPQSALRATFLGPRIVEMGASDFHVSTGAACHSTSKKCVPRLTQYCIERVFMGAVIQHSHEASLLPSRPSAVLMECLRGAGRPSELVEELASNAVRVSFGRWSSLEDADRVATGIAKLYHIFIAELE